VHRRNQTQGFGRGACIGSQLCQMTSRRALHLRSLQQRRNTHAASASCDDGRSLNVLCSDSAGGGRGGEEGGHRQRAHARQPREALHSWLALPPVSICASFGCTAPEHADADASGALKRWIHLRQVHGMHTVDAVAEQLVAEIGSRSKTSGFAAAAADEQQTAPAQAQDGDAAAASGPAATA
jgi:hypothetical protein